MISSQYKITYDGEVLLDYGDRCERLPEFPGTGTAQSVEFAGAAVRGVFGRGNAAHGASWTRLKNWSDHEEAQGQALFRKTVVPLGEAHTLTIQIENGATFTIANFVMTQADFSPEVFHGFHVRESYAGEGGAITATVPDGLS